MALPLTFTFHVGKFTVTITVRRTHRRGKSEVRDEKTTATLASDGVLRSDDHDPLSPV